MVSEGKGRIFRRKDGKFLLYLPKDLCEDSMFPFKKDWDRSKRVTDSIYVKVKFIPGGPKELIVEEWKEVEG